MFYPGKRLRICKLPHVCTFHLTHFLHCSGFTWRMILHPLRWEIASCDGWDDHSFQPCAEYLPVPSCSKNPSKLGGPRSTSWGQGKKEVSTKKTLTIFFRYLLQGYLVTVGWDGLCDISMSENLGKCILGYAWMHFREATGSNRLMWLHLIAGLIGYPI